MPLPRAPSVFRGVSCSWLPLAGSTTFWLRLADLLLQGTFVVGLAVSWSTTWCSTLCLRSLPCRSFPLVGSATFLTQVAGLLLRWCLVVGVVSSMPRLVLYLVPCSSAGACSLRSLSCSMFTWGFSAFSVTGCLSFCYPGGVG